MEAVKYKTFTQELLKLALLWFHQLPSRTIRSYIELIQKFVNNFSVNVKIFRKLEEHFMVVQEKNESLKKFVTRLNVKYVNIPNWVGRILI